MTEESERAARREIEEREREAIRAKERADHNALQAKLRAEREALERPAEARSPVSKAGDDRQAALDAAAALREKRLADAREAKRQADLAIDKARIAKEIADAAKRRDDDARKAREQDERNRAAQADRDRRNRKQGK